jgi:hypothetical protein
MTTLILTNDGKTYVGITADDAVSRMREAGIFTFGKTNHEYMSFVSRQVATFSGHTVRDINATEFLNDMASLDIITLTEF